MLLPIGKGCAITPPNTSVWTYLPANFLRKLAKNLKSKTIANTTSSICSFILPFFQKNKITSKYRLSLHYRLKSHRFFTYGEQSLMLMLPIKCSCYATTFDCYAISLLLPLILHNRGAFLRNYPRLLRNRYSNLLSEPVATKVAPFRKVPHLL